MERRRTPTEDKGTGRGEAEARRTEAAAPAPVSRVRGPAATAPPWPRPAVVAVDKVGAAVAPDDQAPGSGGGRLLAGGRRPDTDGALLRSLSRRILRRLDELSWHWERMSMAEYLELFRRPGRLFWLNFLAGMARGLGAAIGFTLLGALLLLALQRAVELNLPYLGSLIAELLRIVREELDGMQPGPGGVPAP